MSIEYGLITGYGVELSDIEPHIDYDKVTDYINQKFNADFGDSAIENLEDCMDELSEYDLTCGLADLMASCNPYDRLDGVAYEEHHFLVYPMSLPWARTPHDVFTEAEAQDILLDAIMPFVKTGTSREDIAPCLMNYYDAL